MVSDGEPRNYNLPDGSPSAKLGTANNPLALDPAITAANAFKASGGHVLSLGVQRRPTLTRSPTRTSS